MQGCSWRKNGILCRSDAQGTVPPLLNLGHVFSMRGMVRHDQAGSWELFTIVMCMWCVLSIKKEWDPSRMWTMVSCIPVYTTKPLALKQWIFFTCACFNSGDLRGISSLNVYNHLSSAPTPELHGSLVRASDQQSWLDLHFLPWCTVLLVTFQLNVVPCKIHTSTH